MEFVATTEDGQLVRYRDPKRYRWLAAFISPVLALATVGLCVATSSPWPLFLPLVHSFVLIPFLDGVFGEDAHNPPDAIVPVLSQDPYYRVLMHVDIAM